MAVAVKIYSPAGTEYDITSRIHWDDAGSIVMRFEEETNTFITDDLSLSLRNEDGYFTSLWTIPMDPSLRTIESTGLGAWKIKITRGLVTRFEGDLDVASVVFNIEDKLVESSWFGGMKRAEVPADGIKRAVPDPLNFTCVLNNRKLTFSATVASLYLEKGDRILCSALKRNGNIIDQELEIHELGPTDTLTDKQLRTRQGVQKAYTEGALKDPFYKTNDSAVLTVEDCVEYCLDELGVSSGNQQIIGAGKSLQVDTFKTEGETISGCLSKLAIYSGFIWWKSPDGKWYFKDRNDVKSVTIKNLDTGGRGGTTLLCGEPLQASQEDWYDSVIVTGTAQAWAPDSKPRSYRHGSGRTKPLEIETEFTSSLEILQDIAEQVYSRVCKQRIKAEIRVKDDGTNYFLLDRVSFGGHNWEVIEISEEVQATELRGEIELTVLSEDGLTPSATGSPWDINMDEEAPFPPVDCELGKGTDDPDDRPAWWSEARTQYPSGINEFPIKRPRAIVDDDDDPKTPPKIIWERLWFYRFKPMDPTDDPPDGYEITVFNPAKGIEKPLQHHGYKQPLVHTDGYFYFPLYLAAKTGAPEKWVVARTWNARRDLSAYSDPASTADWGGAVEDPNPFDGVTMAVTRLATEEYSNTYQIDFTKDGSPYVVPELEKIKICKSTASATEPDLTRKQPPIDCLDHATDPAVCTESSFETEVAHAKGATPRVWFRAVAYDGHKMDWTYDSTSTEPSLPAPLTVEMTYDDASPYTREIVATFSGGLPSNYTSARVYATDYASPPQDVLGNPSIWGTAMTPANSLSGNTLVITLTQYWRMASGAIEYLPTADIELNFAVCLYNDDGDGPLCYGYHEEGTAPPVTATELFNDTPVTDTNSHVLNEYRFFKFTIPANCTGIQVTVTSVTGGLNLYVERPTTAGGTADPATQSNYNYLGGYSSGTWTATESAPSLCTQGVWSTSVCFNQATTAFTIKVVWTVGSTTYSISGTVTNYDSGLAISGVVVKAFDGSTYYPATTNSSGVYTIPNLLPGSYTISAEKSGYYFVNSWGATPVTITSANVTGKNITGEAVDTATPPTPSLVSNFPIGGYIRVTWTPSGTYYWKIRVQKSLLSDFSTISSDTICSGTPTKTSPYDYTSPSNGYYHRFRMENPLTGAVGGWKATTAKYQELE